MHISRIKNDGRCEMRLDAYSTEEQGKELMLLRFPQLETHPEFGHFFTTRLGGVSENEYYSMNLSFTREDLPERVSENYARLGRVLGISPDDFIGTYQTHTSNVMRVGREQAGMGVVRDKPYRDVDGLITNEPGLVLFAYFADCVPLYFIDPVKRAVGLSHSGWRGTAAGMGRKTVEAMKREFGTFPGDLLCAVGPSICRDCYEVSEDVAEVFRQEFPERHDYLLFPGKMQGKYQLDLHRANRLILENAGVRPENIFVTDICTCCNPHLLYSHRVMGEKRGNLAGGVYIKRI